MRPGWDLGQSCVTTVASLGWNKGKDHNCGSLVTTRMHQQALNKRPRDSCGSMDNQMGFLLGSSFPKIPIMVYWWHCDLVSMERLYLRLLSLVASL